MTYTITLHKLGQSVTRWNNARKRNESIGEFNGPDGYRTFRRLASGQLYMTLASARIATRESVEYGCLTHSLAVQSFRDGQHSQEKF